MNAHSQFSQSAIPNRHTTCGPWATKKTTVCEKNCFFHIAHSWQSSIYIHRSMPEGLILSQTSAFWLPPPFWNHGPIIIIHASIHIKSVSEMVSYPQWTSLSWSKKTLSHYLPMYASIQIKSMSEMVPSPCRVKSPEGRTPFQTWTWSVPSRSWSKKTLPLFH